MSKWIDEQIKAYENAAKTYPILRSCGDRWEVLEALKKAEEALKHIKKTGDLHYRGLIHICDIEEEIDGSIAAIEDLWKE